MTDPHDFQDLDATARQAARGLHEHVLERIDPDQALARVPVTAARTSRGRLIGAAAAAILLLGSVAVLGDQNGRDGRDRLEVDEDGNKLPAPEPGTLTPLGPRDGKDSIQLPLTVTPSATGLHDGDTVTVSAPGFAPGESVGLVQCAQEAGGETREQRGGIDACDISPYTNITADANGVATGDYQVQRFLTTPMTGTVDCAAQAERCLVAMGALNDYDRSGGYGIAFAEPGPNDPTGPAVPTLVVTPAEGLHDGDTVHVTGDGYAPNQPVSVQVCSKDPAACWETGTLLDTLPANEDCFEECEGFGGYGLPVDDSGHLEGDVPVWQFLPATEPGSYIDCAVSECSLRLTTGGDTAPPPARLGFAPGSPGPVPGAVAVTPTEGLATGDTVVVRGMGFTPGAYLSIGLCVAPAEQPEAYGCSGGDDGQGQVDEDGGFAVEFTLPDVSGMFMEDGNAPSCTSGAICTIRVDAYSEGPSLRPQFPPAPVLLTYRTG